MISIHTEIGLSAGPGQAEAALRAIQTICAKTDETLAEVLSHPDAVSQASAVSFGVGVAPVGQRLGVAKGLFEVPETIDGYNEETSRMFLGGKK